MLKREKYISWDGYFMIVAFIASLRSKDPSTRNGACIVKDNKIVSIGYNGFINIVENDKTFPWDRKAENKADTKYPYVVHAEMNAILNSDLEKTKNSILYLYSEKNYYPCSECTKSIIQAGIKDIKMINAERSNTDVYDWDLSLRMFSPAGVNIHFIDEEDIKKDFQIVTDSAFKEILGIDV